MGVQVFDLAVELRRRDVSAAELAAEAGVDRVTVARIARGKSAGLPRTRRAIVKALR
jgi:transcriptional regulator with XRE-family HTH domain